jgi:hypothetical protein
LHAQNAMGLLHTLLSVPTLTIRTSGMAEIGRRLLQPKVHWHGGWEGGTDERAHLDTQALYRAVKRRARQLYASGPIVSPIGY